MWKRNRNFQNVWCIHQTPNFSQSDRFHPIQMWMTPVLLSSPPPKTRWWFSLIPLSLCLPLPPLMSNICLEREIKSFKCTCIQIDERERGMPWWMSCYTFIIIIKNQANWRPKKKKNEVSQLQYNEVKEKRQEKSSQPSQHKRKKSKNEASDLH